MSDEPVDKLGMTDEQWEWFQKATRGYGDQDENGIDLSLLRANLRLTPTERLEKHRRALELLIEVKRAATAAGLRPSVYNDGAQESMTSKKGMTRHAPTKCSQ